MHPQQVGGVVVADSGVPVYPDNGVRLIVYQYLIKATYQVSASCAWSAPTIHLRGTYEGLRSTYDVPRTSFFCGSCDLIILQVCHAYARARECSHHGCFDFMAMPGL